MLHIKHIIKNHTAIVIFHIVFAVIITTNFPFGHSFIGWDALNPEFDFGLNLRRSIFSFWQENYGLGLLGGHGFGATLPHVIITYLLSFVVPNIAIRSVFTFLCLYLGGIGMYLFTQTILKAIVHTQESFKPLEKYLALTALVSALFYMLNLGTLQMFYVQLEAFVVHFAALPWLLLSAFLLITRPTHRVLLLSLIINFFASIQGFIPSLFVAYCIALGIFLMFYLLQGRFSKTSITRCLLVIAVTLITNLYWFLPLSYYQLTRKEIYLNSYNNLISTPHFIDINKKFGDLSQVALLKGYLFDSYEINDFILKPWITHQTPLVLGTGYAFFLLSLIGCISSLIFFRQWYIKGLSGIFAFFFISIATNAFPFSLVSQILQSVSATYQQAFRIAFTKFSLGVSFSYSIFLGLGILFLLHLLFRHKPFAKHAWILFAVVIAAVVWYSFPTFQGNLLYKQLKLTIPNAYGDIFTYFKDQPDGRIADFPQDCPEGWFAYKWGYFGSGFYWYGIKQPFLSRTFDVWSNYNENYYWEITQALREENYQKIDGLFQKYDVKWVLYDPNIIYCRNQGAFLLHEDFISYLEKSPNYQLVRTFDDGVLPIKLFEYKQHNSQSYVSIATDLPTVGPSYRWNDNDSAYQDVGDYINDQKNPSRYYPFRSLFNKRKTTESEIDITSDKDSITFSTKLPLQLVGHTVTMKNNMDSGHSVPVEITLNQSDIPSSYGVTATIGSPRLYLDNQLLGEESAQIQLGEFRYSGLEPIHLSVDGIEIVPDENGIYMSEFSFNLANTVSIFTQDSLLFEWIGQEDETYQHILNTPVSIPLPSFTSGELKIVVPKITDERHGSAYFSDLNQLLPIPCNESLPTKRNRYELSLQTLQKYIRLTSTDSSQCVHARFDLLPTSSSYLMEIRNRHIRGNYPTFSIANKSRIVYQDVPLSSSNPDFISYYHIVPPGFQTEIGYEVRYNNVSENNQPAVNDFAGVGMWQIPYEFLASLHLKESSNPTQKAIIMNDKLGLRVSHPNETSYHLTVNASLSTPKDTYILLAQSYDPGWKAYYLTTSSSELLNQLHASLPFLFGQQLQNQVMVNNWQNGWQVPGAVLNPQNRIIIVYLPQYLLFAGILGSGLAGFALFHRLSRRNQ